MYTAVRKSLFALFLISVSHLGWAFGTSENAFGNAVAEPDFLKVDEAFIFTESVEESGVLLNWKIAPEYYLYKERFKFKALSEGASLGEPQFSTNGKRKVDPYFGEVHVIYDEVQVFLPVTLNPGIEDAELKITYQGCAEAGLCYPPTHKQVLYIPPVESTATVRAPTTPNKTDTSADVQTRNLDDASGVFAFIESSSLATIVGIFFLLGVGLTFTPCVFPMIPIMTSIIAGQSQPTVAKSFALSVVYVLGMAITYAAAGVATGLLGAGANVQAALQNPYLLSVFAIVFFALALAMFGLYELQLPAFIRDRLNNKSQNLSGGHLGSVFLIGALSALIVSPCVSAPLAGALLYISATADATIGGASLFALGLGMGLPLILVAVGGGKYLPKAGKWMDAVKAVFGVMLIAVAIWLVGRFAAPEVTMLLWALLLGISATQMGAFDAAQSGWPRVFKGLGLIIALLAALQLLGAVTGAKDPLRPLERFTLQTGSAGMSSSTLSKKHVFEVIGSRTELSAQLSKVNDRPVMVDFYADWCISCIVMENQVFPLPQISSKLDQFHLVKADVTNNTEEHQALLNKFGLFGPPSILFFDKQGNELESLRIVGEISAANFEQRLARALEGA